MRTQEWKCTTIASDADAICDITDQVAETVSGCDIRDGHVTVRVTDPDATLIVNERESGLLEDIRATMRRTADHRLGSDEVVLPAVGGRLRLGRWQRLLLVELAGGGERSFTVTIEGG